MVSIWALYAREEANLVQGQFLTCGACSARQTLQSCIVDLILWSSHSEGQHQQGLSLRPPCKAGP